MEWRTQQPRRQQQQRETQQRMIVLAGLPGAGKSTLAQRLQALGWVVINQVQEQPLLWGRPASSWALLCPRTSCKYACRPIIPAIARSVLDPCIQFMLCPPRRCVSTCMRLRRTRSAADGHARMQRWRRWQLAGRWSSTAATSMSSSARPGWASRAALGRRPSGCSYRCRWSCASIV